jgi:hypothetical protein
MCNKDKHYETLHIVKCVMEEDRDKKVNIYFKFKIINYDLI